MSAKNNILKTIIDKFTCIKQYLINSNFFNTSIFIFSCSGLFGALFFIFIFGTAILDFRYTDWLMNYNDLTQHYLGWEFFRISSWSFPLGLLENIVYPYRISVIYTDSIPLFAMFFRLLSPLLPSGFQYFGLFGIICYISKRCVYPRGENRRKCPVRNTHGCIFVTRNFEHCLYLEPLPPFPH